MNQPSKMHAVEAKRILRYLQGTKKLDILYKKENDNNLVGFTDSDWAGSLDDKKSTSGYIFCLGSNVIALSSKKQKAVRFLIFSRSWIYYSNWCGMWSHLAKEITFRFVAKNWRTYCYLLWQYLYNCND